MNKFKKALITTTVTVTMVAMIAPVAGAATVPSVCAGVTFTQNLRVGSVGMNVKCLQASLNALGFTVAVSGAGSAGMETTYFGSRTLAAVRAYQSAQGWIPAMQVGPLTRAALNAWLAGSTPAPSPTPTPTPTPTPGLSGGAGDITVASLSTYASTNVGEGSSNVKVAAFTIEADSGSDVAITSMKIQARQLTAADDRDIKKYMKDVSLWMGGTEIGRATASEFSDASTTDLWEKTIATSNAVIRKSVKGTFYIAVSANNSIDTGDSDTDDWQISVSSIRFLDGAGVTTTSAQTTDVTTDALTGVEQTFDFATSLVANAIELKVALKDSDKTINKSHLYNAKTGAADNDGVEILSFTLEAKGSDIKVQEFPILLTSSGETNEATLIKSAHLYRGTTKLGSESVADGGAVTFDNLDFTVMKGAKDNFKIVVDVQDLTGALDIGDRVQADLSNGSYTETIARDNTSEKLTATELTGSLDGEETEFRDVGFTLTLVSTSAVISHAGDPNNTNNASDHDQGTFKIVMDVTAWDGDIFIDETAPVASGADAADLTLTGSPTETASSLTCTSGSCTDETNSVKIPQGETGRITISAVLTAASDGLVDMALADLHYALTDANGGLYFTHNLTDFKTPQLFLNMDQS